jgi:hypothetical protein
MNLKLALSSFLAVSSCLNILVSSCFESEVKEISSYFHLACKINSFYLSDSKEIGINVDDFQKTLDSIESEYSDVSFSQISYEQIENYIFPIYARALSIKAELKKGLVKKDFLLSCQIERSINYV